MHFDFSEDQRRLQDELRRMLGAISTPAEVRRVLEGTACHSAASWRALADIGALGLALPEALGGAGMGRLELCLLAEEAGRALAAVPLLGTTYLAAELLLHAASPALQAQYLPRIAAGTAILTAAIDQHGQHAGPTPAPLLAAHTLTAQLDAVADGMLAEAIIVLAGDALVLVDLAGPGVQRCPRASLDPTRPLAQIACTAAPAQVLCPAGGRAIAARISDGAAVLLAFEQVGGAEKALYAARDHALERRAFGRVIGGFQAVRHKLADIYIAVELARAHAYYGAWALATNAPELPRAAAAARVAATDAYTLAAEESLHLHGGIGFTWEMDCHLHLRRARWLGQILGTRHYWEERLAAALIAEAGQEEAA